MMIVLRESNRTMHSSVASKENLLGFTRSSPTEHGRTVLNLVVQAAELFSGMEEHVRQTEARAESIRKSAAEKMQLAEKRIEVVERTRREAINEAECKLQDASRALQQAQARIVAAEDQVTALEFRAQAAEAQLRDASQALLLIEDTIRKRLLSPSAV